MLPAQDHSVTSIRAADSMEAHAPTLRDQVYNFMRNQRSFGATDEEIQLALVMNPSTQRPRRIELLNDGLIEKTALTRKTRSGRSASVWKVVSSFGAQKSLFM